MSAVHDDSLRPRISLVVCTTGEANRLAPLGARLRAVLAAVADAEVIVVDNSRAGELRFDDDGIRVVRCVARGLSFARETGCRAARGDVVVFTDDDVDFDPEWPARMAEPVLAGRLDAAAATVVLGEEFDAITSPVRREWLAESNLPHDGDRIRLVGAGMALHRDVLVQGVWDQRLGAGAPTFPFGEEQLFELVVRDAGARVGLAPDARVVHHPDPSRTTDDHYRRIAMQKGLSDAYLAHHWYGERLRRPRLRLLRRRLRLWLYRRQASVGRPRSFEGELALIQSVGVARGHVIVGGEPRRYVRRTAPPV